MQTCEPTTADTFSVDIQAFVQKQEQDRKPFFSESDPELDALQQEREQIFSGDPEGDTLMVKAIQVLRIHLLELEKVNELCKDFCNRYIGVLKTKMQTHFQNENIFRPDYLPNCLQEELNATTPVLPPLSTATAATAPQTSSASVVIQQPTVSVATINQGQIVSGGTVYQMVQTPQGIVAQPIQIQTAPQVIQGSTPISQIGTSSNAAQTLDNNSNVTALSGSVSDDDDDSGKKGRTKRGVLPKHATNIMRSWLFQHIVHPYPTEDEKRQIAGQTNLSILQVNNWFINARRRILQPMLDASNPEPNSKSKKTKPTNTKPT
ncbi:PREDICTED: homeobox protein PKNOX2-like, partial [Priapulus caudatus]|uniref:Homeobox protein PKNOX2-like n=1 Tax=Priapulus caudatus TaxID=37621 RepID=A0ABM1EM29_PRICU